MVQYLERSNNYYLSNEIGIKSMDGWRKYISFEVRLWCLQGTLQNHFVPHSFLLTTYKNKALSCFIKIGSVTAEILLTMSLCGGGGVVCKVIFMSNPT